MLLQIEKLLSKNREEAYWNARKASKKEADAFKLKLHLSFGLILSILIILGCEYKSKNLDSYFKWTGVVKEIIAHEKFGIQQQDTYEYIIEYNVENQNFIFSKMYLGTPQYNAEQNIPLLIYKYDHSISQIDESLETVKIVSIISAFIFLAALIYSIKHSPKVKYIKLQTNKKRGL